MLNIANFTSPVDFSERLANAPKIRSPHANEDVRCREDWCWPDVTLIKHDSKVYLVKSNLLQALAGRMFRGALYAAASEKGEVYIWAVKLSAPTAVDAAIASCQSWCKVTWSQADKEYQTTRTDPQPPEPNWRFANFGQMIESAFSGRVLESLDQEVVKEILGNK